MGIKLKIFLSVFVFPILLAGCQSAEPEEVLRMEEEKAEESRDYENEEDRDREKDAVEKFTHLKQMEIWDYDDTSVRDEVYMPKGTKIDDGYAYYYGHGLDYSAIASSSMDAEEHYDSFAYLLEIMLESWHQPYPDYTDIYSSGVLENGVDRYYIISSRERSYDGTVGETRLLEYMNLLPSGLCVEWSLSLNVGQADEKTDLIINEIEQCYDIDLKLMKTDSPLMKDTSDQDVYEVKEGHEELEDLDEYQYLGAATLSDYYGEVFCPVLIPKARDTNVREEHAYSFLHGVMIEADMKDFFYSANLAEEMEYDFGDRYVSREDDTRRIQNLWKSEMLPIPGFEDALYMEISYEKKGVRSEGFFSKGEILYCIRLDNDNYLSVEMFFSGEDYDASTNTVIREIERAYGIDLSKYYNTMSEERNEDEDLRGGERDITLAKLLEGKIADKEEVLPDTVLWFNATYAPLTYCNGCDWKLVGGVEPTVENKAMVDYGLSSSWNVYDRETALEAIEKLKTRGHRQICRECMEELEELGLLDLDERAFKRAFLRSDIEDKDYRYILAYEMYQNGYDADVMAAWDLCRINQLCADFYICGYMTYEEAMDTSLENSLLLQQMYSSWEEMVEGYMMGLKFWSRDSETNSDSITRERQRCYNILRMSEDSPYMLDWDMKLEKSW